MKIETIKVKDSNPRGWRIINKHEFDASKHEEYEARPKRKYTRRKAAE